MKVTINLVVGIDDDDIDLLVETAKDWDSVHCAIKDYLLYDYGCDEDSAEYDELYDVLRAEVERRLEE